MLETSHKVSQLPRNPDSGEIFEIETNDVSYLTHNLFKYPCKYIPQIPGWAIDEYLSGRRNGLVHDPFSGSGTSLVEAVLKGHRASGSDVDPLSRLLSKVKATPLTPAQLQDAQAYLTDLKLNAHRLDGQVWIPDFPNIDLFFTQESQRQLGALRESIETLEAGSIKDLMLIVMGSVVKNASLADDQSPKPYVSKKYPKLPKNALDLFITRCESALSRMHKFSPLVSGELVGIGRDAREFDDSLGPIDLAVTSPPYINAFDYVRSLKLENYWLGLVTDEEVSELRRTSIGTESVPKEVEVSGLPESVTSKLSDIAKVDPKRSRVTAAYFNAMKSNIRTMSQNLLPDSHYVIVVADSFIRGNEVPTSEYLREIAESEGFEFLSKFGYQIRNRYLRFPRSGRGGFMDVDWIITLRKRA